MPVLRQSVRDALTATQRQWEGSYDYMYTDHLGLVTTAIGYLLDDNNNKSPMANEDAYAPALLLPWVHKSDGKEATKDEIIADWKAVKAAHGTAFDAPHDAGLTKLKLNPSDIVTLTLKRADVFAGELAKDLPGFADYPADAQMALMGDAWAMGGAFVSADHFNALKAAAEKGDWKAAESEAHFQDEVPQRKAGHDLMFQNAARVAAQKGDPEKLWYPAEAPETGIPSASGGAGLGTLAAVAAVLVLGGLALWGLLKV